MFGYPVHRYFEYIDAAPVIVNSWGSISNHGRTHSMKKLLNSNNVHPIFVDLNKCVYFFFELWLRFFGFFFKKLFLLELKVAFLVVKLM